MIVEKMTDTDRRKDATGTFLLAVGYCLLLYMLQFFFYRAGIFSAYPSNESLRWWDANIYEEISRLGYRYPNPDNTGWYILFPWLWRVLHVNYIGISIVNILCFAAGFTIVTRIYPIGVRDKMLWLTTPSLYFMIVPYSEALFCLLSAVSFYGIARHHRGITWAGLFLLSLTRATAVFLIPALFVVELLTSRQKSIFVILRSYLFNYAFPTFAGLVFFVVEQYSETGVWFAYYKYQADVMAHKFAIPALPFSNYYGGSRILWLTAISALPCVIALFVLMRMLWRRAVKSELVQDKVFVMTLVYLPVTLLCMIFCNPKWGSGTTNLIGLHRYTCCTPFIFVFLYHFAGKERIYGWKDYLIVLLIGNMVWMSMGAYTHIRELLFFNFLTLIVFGYMLHSSKKTSWVSISLVMLNSLFQVMLLQQFLQGLFTD